MLALQLAYPGNLCLGTCQAALSSHQLAVSLNTRAGGGRHGGALL